MKTVKKESNSVFQKFQTQKLTTKATKHLKGGEGEGVAMTEAWPYYCCARPPIWI